MGGRGRPARGLGPACDWPVPHSETPLTLAAQTEGSVEVIRTLCLGGAHIDFRARDGMTALHKAACARHCLALTVRCQLPQTTTAMLTARTASDELPQTFPLPPTPTALLPLLLNRKRSSVPEACLPAPTHPLYLTV